MWNQGSAHPTADRNGDGAYANGLPKISFISSDR